jgi:hypothetical protein
MKCLAKRDEETKKKKKGSSHAMLAAGPETKRSRISFVRRSSMLCRPEFPATEQL